MDDVKDVIINSGTTIHRMSAYANVDYSGASKPLYAAFEKGDVATYMTMLKDWSGTGKRYDVEFKALKDIKVPTRKEAERIFNELYTNNPEYRKQLADTLTEAYSKILNLDKDYVRKVTTPYLLKQNPFDAGIFAIMKNRGDSKILIDEYRKLGYDGLIDYHDTITGFVNNPLIVFDPSGTLQKVGETFVDRSFMLETLQELPSESKLAGFPVETVIQAIIKGELGL